MVRNHTLFSVALRQVAFSYPSEYGFAERLATHTPRLPVNRIGCLVYFFSALIVLSAPVALTRPEMVGVLGDVFRHVTDKFSFAPYFAYIYDGTLEQFLHRI